MRKKILVLLLVVFALTLCAQIFLTTQAEKAAAQMQPKEKDCYWLCIKPVYGAECQPDLPGCCREWGWVCLGHDAYTITN